MNGLQLACSYSFGCPEIEALEERSLILDIINNPGTGKTSYRRVKALLEKLDPFLFYQLISLSAGEKRVFGKSVVLAHWLGDSALRPITAADVQAVLNRSDVIKNFEPVRLARLKGLIGGKPHHNFAVIHTLSDTIRSTSVFPRGLLINTIACLVLPAKVLKVNRKILVSLPRLCIPGGMLSLSFMHREAEKGFVKDVMPGDFISLHLGIARQRITKRRAMDLLRTTREAVNFFNRKRVN